ncbi:hypothetical protein [Pseudomonas sp. DC3000-4b1]|uniref:hypothetical protein n=1 Tax=unclassified Pseudomonas TaxID=196821 RepID=UPI003CF90CFD
MSFNATRSILTITILTMVSSASFADDFYEQDGALRLRLRNELRRADKPSAAPNNDIYAWVQGVALEYNSPYAWEHAGIDVGFFRTQRLATHDDWSTRWYLDGQDSFNLYTAAIKVKVADNLKLRIGRMVTDSAYSGQDDIPLINSSSQRTQPTMSDAALVKYSATSNLDIYGMYRFGVYYYPDVSEGVHKAGPINPNTYEYDTLRPQYLTSAVYRNGLDTYALTLSWQNDVAAQAMTRISQRYAVGKDNRHYFKPEFVALYAKLNGTSASYEGADETYVLGGRFNYVSDKGCAFLAIGKTGGKLYRLSGVDTDVSYTYDLSIDRNYNNMWSWQAGYLWQLPNDMQIGVSQLFTNGYEDYKNDVRVKGTATGVLAGYNPKSGPLKGFRSTVIISSAREDRQGSRLGNHLDYYDVKLNFQYDLNLF